MKDNPSNYQMEKSLELLKSIKKVTPSESLFNKIEQKIERTRNNVVPMAWIKIAAAVFICVFSVEIYLISNPSSTSDLAEIIPTTDNTLYHE